MALALMAALALGCSARSTQCIDVKHATDEAHSHLQDIAAQRPGEVWSCWPEINPEMPEGYEVICMDGNGIEQRER